MYKYSSLLLFFCAQAITAQDVIQDNELDQIIINEEKLSLSFSKHQKNIQVITKDEIATMPGSSVAELLSYVVGVDSRQRGPFGSQSDISIDGGSFEQTMVLWNGVKMGDPQTAHHSMNLPIPISAIERIEILKGPASRIYGINSLTGAINIVTLSNFSDFVTVNTFAASSFNKKETGDGNGIYAGYGMQIVAGKTIKNTQHLFGFSRDETNGQRYNTAANNNKFMYQGKYFINNKNTLDFTGSYIDNAFGANGYYASPIDNESFELVETLLVSLGSKHQLSDVFSLQTRFSNRYNEDDYRFYRNDWSKARSLHFSNAFMFELKTNYKLKVGEINIGYELRNEEITSSNLGNHNRNNMGAFTEFKTQYFDKLDVSLGAYFNYNSDYGFQWYPGIDLGYEINDKWKLLANVASSQRIPSFTDLYINQLPGNKGNENLKPEEAWQYDLTVQYNNKSIEFLANAFNRSVDNFIDWIREDSSQPYIPNNFGTQQMLGLHAKLKQNFQWNNAKLSYHLSYQYLEPSINQNKGVFSKYVVESLKHQGILGIQYQYRTFGLQFQNRFVKRYLNDGYFVSDIKFQNQFNQFNLYIQCTNMFNSSYKEVAAVPMPTRWFQLGVTYNLAFKK